MSREAAFFCLLRRSSAYLDSGIEEFIFLVTIEDSTNAQ